VSRHTVIVANIKSVPRMSAAQVDSDIAALFDMAGKKSADAVFGAEIAFANYRSSWRKHGKKKGYKPFGLPRECPVSLRRGVRVKVLSRLLSKGIAKVTPNRYATIVKHRPSKVAYIATHLVSRWQDYARADATHDERKRLAAMEITKIEHRIERLHAKGWTVIVGGDLNALSRVVWHHAQVQVLPVSGSNLARMMQLAVIPAPGVTVTPVSHGNHHAGLHTDHPFRFASFDLKEKR
jgi:hypothetical protein